MTSASTERSDKRILHRAVLSWSPLYHHYYSPKPSGITRTPSPENTYISCCCGSRKPLLLWIPVNCPKPLWTPRSPFFQPCIHKFSNSLWWPTSVVVWCCNWLIALVCCGGSAAKLMVAYFCTWSMLCHWGQIFWKYPRIPAAVFFAEVFRFICLTVQSCITEHFTF